MKARVQLIAAELAEALPTDDAARATALLAMLHPDTDAGIDRRSDERGIAGWGIWPLSLVVAERGLHDIDRSLALLREMTMRSTAEFAIRPFIVVEPARVFQTLARWTSDPNEHVRRLVSEGSRPRLPWGLRLRNLVADPSPTLPLLEALRDDPSPYVRRSVANHLNDIVKDHQDLVVSLAVDWSDGAPPERRTLLRHACRSLLKQGRADVMTLFGFTSDAVTIDPLVLSSDRVRMGEDLMLSTSLHSASDAPQRLSIDYVLHALKANGSRTPKVFKGGTVTLEPGETRRFARTHRFREVTTRRHYAGEHAIALRVNGVDSEPVRFELDVQARPHRAARSMTH